MGDVVEVKPDESWWIYGCLVLCVCLRGKGVRGEWFDWGKTQLWVLGWYLPVGWVGFIKGLRVYLDYKGYKV